MSTRHLVLVGSYAAADAPGIHAVTIDLATGSLEVVAGWAGVTDPSYLAFSPDGTRLYAVSETAPGWVHSFTFDRASMQIEATGRVPSGGDHPCHLAVDPSGRWLAVANYGSGSVSVLGLGDDGGAGPMAHTLQHQGRGPDPDRQAGPHAHGVAFTPDGRHLVVADLGIDRVSVYGIDPGDGSLTFRSDAGVAAGAGPRSVAFLPDGSTCVIANELDNTVAIGRLDGSDGSMHPIDRRSTLGGRSIRNLVAAVRCSPDGRHVYVSNRGDDSIAVFDVEPSGVLTHRGAAPCGGAWPRDFDVLPGGRHLLVANERSDELVLLPVSGDGTTIGAPIARVAVPSPTCVLVSGRDRPGGTAG